MLSHGYSLSALDFGLLSLITQEAPSESSAHGRATKHKLAAERRPVGTQDTLMIAAAASAGPEVTRAHYFHDFFPGTSGYAQSECAHPAPAAHDDLAVDNPAASGSHFPVPGTRSSRPLSGPSPPPLDLHSTVPPITSPLFASATATPSSSTPLPPLEIECLVRTRIPTPHGHVFLHLYKNNHDNHEHLAFVADSAQMASAPPSEARPYLRSKTLDREWREGETGMERIVRGAYVGRLGPGEVNPSLPGSSAVEGGAKEPALVRIHSECFTGEVIGSQRCDCGEQLDEAMRLITTRGHGVVVYLRQEGRGIGLLEKMRAYNLQDLGHDTVTANLLLGHGADLRTYDIAGAILHDLGIEEVRLLTNNPDKIDKIKKEGVNVVERVEMVPRSWGGGRRKAKKGKGRTRMSGAALLALAAESSGMDGDESDEDSADDEDSELSCEDESSVDDHSLRHAGVGMIGGSTTRSAELDKYLRTKIERMGHMLDAPSTPPTSRAESPARRSRKAHRAEVEETPLTSSVVSLESEGSVECGSGCEECTDGTSDAIEYAAEV
ncbi:hypothetical protein RQP46_004155 [Phenoliferia psychrophenolica]